MIDPIERQDVLNLIRKTHMPEEISMQFLYQGVKELPSVERKKGKWIKMSDADGIYWACSECGEYIPRVPHYNPQFDLFPRLKSIEKPNFCPNCGADMKGE